MGAANDAVRQRGHRNADVSLCLLQKPQPQKPQPPDWQALLSPIRALSYGRRCSAGTAALNVRHQDQISGRNLHQVLQEERDHQLACWPDRSPP
jgi:hypothetical protein